MAAVWDPLTYALTNNLMTNEPETNFAFVQDILVSSKVISTLDRAGQPSDLGIAASSNINVLAANDISLYATSNTRIHASNEEILNISLSNDGNALITTGASRILHVRPTDELTSTWLGNFRTFDTTSSPTSRYQELDTVNNLGVRILKNLTANEPVTMNRTLHVANRVTMGEHLRVDGDIISMGNVFTPHLKVWRDDASNGQRVGFGMLVNSSNMMEMYKYVQDSNGSNAIKRVAVFGHSTFDATATPDFSDPNWSNMSGMLLSNQQPLSTASGGGLFFINSNYNIYTNARLGIGNSNPATPLEVAGTITCTTMEADTVITQGGVQAASDGRIKTQVSALDPEECLRRVRDLRPSAFRWLSDPSTPGVGFIAQEVAEVIPEAVSIRNDRRSGLNDFHFLDLQAVLTTLVGAVQALASAAQD